VSNQVWLELRFSESGTNTSVLRLWVQFSVELQDVQGVGF
jgi:hypothetical protein